MNINERLKLYEKAIDLWGCKSQFDMCIEENAELIQAINKFRINPSAEKMKSLCGEIADVEIMIEQMRLILNKDNLIDNIKEEKLIRLSKLLNPSTT